MLSRRDFINPFKKTLKQNKQSSPLWVRPPYGLSESLFQSECVTCESKACASSCDEGIIVINKEGTPILNFIKSGCTFCDDCAKACEGSGMSVLSLGYEHTTKKINAKFLISTEGCVAHHGVICFSCKEPCIDNAILFNGLFNPVIDRDKCTGCGFCFGRCPTQAIVFEPLVLSQNEVIER